MLSTKGRGGRAPPDALAWNDVAWEVPWHDMVGEVWMPLPTKWLLRKRWYFCFEVILIIYSAMSPSGEGRKVLPGAVGL